MYIYVLFLIGQYLTFRLYEISGKLVDLLALRKQTTLEPLLTLKKYCNNNFHLFSSLNGTKCAE